VSREGDRGLKRMRGVGKHFIYTLVYDMCRQPNTLWKEIVEVR